MFEEIITEEEIKLNNLEKNNENQRYEEIYA